MGNSFLGEVLNPASALGTPRRGSAGFTPTEVFVFRGVAWRREGERERGARRWDPASAGGGVLTGEESRALPPRDPATSRWLRAPLSSASQASVPSRTCTFPT